MSGAYFKRDNVNLFYTVEGSGHPVLLLHGWTADQNDWAFQISFLLPLGFKIIALDLRGHGRSSFNDNLKIPAQFDPITMADDAAALLTHLGIDRTQPAIVMGHSLGGTITTELASQYPELVRGIVLVDPSYYMTPPQMDHVVQLLNQQGTSAVPQAVTSFMEQADVYAGKAPGWLPPWHRRRTWGMDSRVILPTFEQMQRRLGQSGVEYLRKVKTGKGVPRLVVSAVNESALVERDAGIDDSFDRVEVISAGHYLHMVAPEEFNALMEGWLTDHRFLP